MHSLHFYAFVPHLCIHKALAWKELTIIFITNAITSRSLQLFFITNVVTSSSSYTSTFLSKEVRKYICQWTPIKIQKVGCPGRFCVSCAFMFRESFILNIFNRDIYQGSFQLWVYLVLRKLISPISDFQSSVPGTKLLSTQGTSLEVQWLRLCLPTQEVQVTPVRELRFPHASWSNLPSPPTHNIKYRNSIVSRGFPGGSDGKESTSQAGDLGSIPGLGRFPRGGHGNLLQYSCLENPMDRAAWWATVHGVAKSRTGLKSVRHDWAAKHTAHCNKLNRGLSKRNTCTPPKIAYLNPSREHHILTYNNFLIRKRIYPLTKLKHILWW